MPKLEVDHIVLAVPNLNAAITYFKEHLNVAPLAGGKHIGLGTHNVLLGLGDPTQRVYLELLAIDPEDQTIYETYPMGLSRDISQPFVASWCIRCANDCDIEEINNAMKKMGKEYQHGDVKKMQRVTTSGETLSWRIAISREQILDSHGQIPFIIKWDNMAHHPTTRLIPECFCSFELKFNDKNAIKHQQNLKTLGLELPDNINFVSNQQATTSLKISNRGISITFSSHEKPSYPNAKTDETTKGQYALRSPICKL